MSVAVAVPMRPTGTALIGLLVGTGLTLVAALGPLVSAVTITVGVETQVGDASGLPDARMLPAALEGVGAVALIFLLTRRPVGRLRWWSVALIFVSLAAGMAAQGAHAVWFDERLRHLELPWRARLLVSFVPPVSGLATLHLVVKMVEDLIGTVHQVLTAPTPADVNGPMRLLTDPALSDDAQPSPHLDRRVLRLVRGNPHATWRVVQDRTGMSEANAKRALTAARRRLQATEQPALAANGARAEV